MKDFLFVVILILVFGSGLLMPVPTSQCAPQGKHSVDTPRVALKLGYLGTQSIPDGCNCTFSSPFEMRRKSPRYMFASDVEDEQKMAWVNIDGKDIQLKLVSAENPRIEKVGSRSTLTYATTGLKLTATYVATWVCPPRDEACEVTRYNGAFTITRNGITRTLNLKGECGC